MKQLILRSTLGGLGAAVALPAAADTTVFSPGIILAADNRGDDGRVAVGTEFTLNRLSGDISGWGGLFQLEFDLDGDGMRVLLGGQGFTTAVGAELGLAWYGRRDQPGQFELQVAPFASLGYVHVAWRLLTHAEGLDMGFSLAGKYPIGADGAGLIPVGGGCSDATPDDGTVCGRPMRDAAGRPWRPVVQIGGPSAPGSLAAAAASLPAAARARLAAAWLDDARDEYAAVAAFARLAGDLAHHGAPAELVAAARRAAVDEVDHARRAFAVASALAGRRLRPLPLAVDRPQARPTPDLATLAAESWLDGAMNEGRAAAEARVGHATAAVPAVRRLTGDIGRDEAGHAALGAAVAEWAARSGGRSAQRALEAARDQRATCAAPDPAGDVYDRAWGRVG